MQLLQHLVVLKQHRQQANVPYSLLLLMPICMKRLSLKVIDDIATDSFSRFLLSASVSCI